MTTATSDDRTGRATTIAERRDADRSTPPADRRASAVVVHPRCRDERRPPARVRVRVVRAVARAAPPRRRIGGVEGRRHDEYLGLTPTGTIARLRGIIPPIRRARVRRSPRAACAPARAWTRTPPPATTTRTAPAKTSSRSTSTTTNPTTPRFAPRRSAARAPRQAQLAPQAPQPFPKRVVRGDVDGDRLVPGL